MKELPVRKPNRLQGYDYSQNGAYFVTICAKDRHELFSRIVVGDGLARPVLPSLARPPCNSPAIELTDIGKEIVRMIDYVNHRYNQCKIVKFVIMPNHVHFIVLIAGRIGRNRQIAGRASPSPTTVGNIVGGLKSGVSRIIGFSPWQRSFHDRIIRNDEEYKRIAEYIQNNPVLWQEDCFYSKS